MPLRARLATPDDWQVLSKLNLEFNGEHTSKEHILKSFQQGRELVVVGLWEESIAGFACAQYFQSFCYNDWCGEITELYVRPGFRQRGLATAMVGLLEDELKKRGVTIVNLLTGVENQVARAAYRKMGYQEIDDELLLRKQL